MRALDGREQETMSRLCRKLRAGDAAKFLREIRMVDEDEEAAELAEQVTSAVRAAQEPRGIAESKVLELGVAGGLSARLVSCLAHPSQEA